MQFELALRNSGPNDVRVTLESSKRAAGEKTGQLQFASRADGIEAISASAYTPLSTLSLTLPMDASWVPFFVAGEFNFPSSNPGDVKIRVSRSSGEIASFSTMVRVRKNADTLSASEKKRYLEALAIHHDVEHGSADSKYLKYTVVHLAAWDMAHFGVGFLTWHRAFVLALERELQVIDASVAIPYWKYAEDSTSIFHKDFLGAFRSGLFGSSLEFTAGNPIAGWSIGTLGSLTNHRPGNGNSAIPVVPLSMLLNNNATYAQIRLAIESSHHGGAHNRLGDWMGSGRSPADPAFFLLHANVDRAWALWQQDKGAFDSTKVDSYVLQGKWENTSGLPKGLFVEDTLWPWDGDTSAAAGRFRLSDLNWLGFSPPSAMLFPQRPGFAPSGPPRVEQMIDYLDTAGNSESLGFCYDDVPFKTP